MLNTRVQILKRELPIVVVVVASRSLNFFSPDKFIRFSKNALLQYEARASSQDDDGIHLGSDLSEDDCNLVDVAFQIANLLRATGG